MRHEKVRCDKPIYLGAAITELVKLHMYWFFYDQVIPCLGRENVELLMTDTDSLMLEIKMKDLWGTLTSSTFTTVIGLNRKVIQGMMRLECSNQRLVRPNH